MSRQRAFDYVAPLDEALVDDDLFPPDITSERVGLVAIAAAMVAEAGRSGDSVRHLEKGCSMRYTVRDDRSRLVAWRRESEPSATELRTLQRTFKIPPSVIASWEMNGSQKVAVFRWSDASGDIYEDFSTVGHIAGLLAQHQFREAREAIPCIHGRLDQLRALDMILAAEEAAKEAAHAAL